MSGLPQPEWSLQTPASMPVSAVDQPKPRFSVTLLALPLCTAAAVWGIVSPKTLTAACDQLIDTTFEAAGLLTDNRGLVIEIGDAEFQVSIIRRR